MWNSSAISAGASRRTRSTPPLSAGCAANSLNTCCTARPNRCDGPPPAGTPDPSLVPFLRDHRKDRVHARTDSPIRTHLAAVACAVRRVFLGGRPGGESARAPIRRRHHRCHAHRGRRLRDVLRPLPRTARGGARTQAAGLNGGQRLAAGEAKSAMGLRRGSSADPWIGMGVQAEHAECVPPARLDRGQWVPSGSRDVPAPLRATADPPRTQLTSPDPRSSDFAIALLRRAELRCPTVVTQLRPLNSGLVREKSRQARVVRAFHRHDDLLAGGVAEKADKFLDTGEPGRICHIGRVEGEFDLVRIEEITAERDIVHTDGQRRRFVRIRTETVKDLICFGNDFKRIDLCQCPCKMSLPSRSAQCAQGALPVRRIHIEHQHIAQRAVDDEIFFSVVQCPIAGHHRNPSNVEALPTWAPGRPVGQGRR
ncbi:hypothetical protein SBRY_50147 [Actinacidiphila bryophytorum]|uniref:Uncharacterized protein n=1 Tax=Actinacidiphila bryophytorum TaxID=1436133 RepID=A0A9W4H400_9ACTN|nr:hypothetical protein SBRY_50147 [Actinacidiphila bryophytorum]